MVPLMSHPTTAKIINYHSALLVANWLMKLVEDRKDARLLARMQSTFIYIRSHSLPKPFLSWEILTEVKNRDINPSSQTKSG